MAEAEAAIERLAAAPADEGLVIREVWLLRLRRLLASADGDEAGYRDYRIATAPWRKRLASTAYRLGRDDDMTAAGSACVRHTRGVV